MFNPLSTIVRQVSAENPDAATLAEAAEILRRGGLVAFPTETVYGLGANALAAVAVERIFAAKGRPAQNPIIVHVADVAGAKRLTSSWPEVADRLAAAFWPGPLTLVLPKRDIVPSIVTAGGPTVGVRVPANAVALALLKAAAVPLAAPSANRSTQISPTTAEHVFTGLEGRVEMILDAGPTSGGLESTVLDLTVTPPRLLRPGLVTPAQIETVLGSMIVTPSVKSESSAEPLRSPGLLERHYAPQAKLIASAGSSPSLIEILLKQVNRVGWLRLTAEEAIDVIGGSSKVHLIEMPTNAAAYSQRLYAALHELDAAGVDAIVVDLPPQSDEWLAVLDRLRRASTNA